MKISQYRQTVFIDHQGKELFWFTVKEWDFCNPYFVTVKINGKIIINHKRNFAPRMELMLPCVERNTECIIELQAFEEEPVREAIVLQPIRKWRVDLFASSHEDLGYCAYVNKLEAESADYLDEALNQIDRDGRYHYFIEHDWWLKAYETYRPLEKRGRLEKALRDGHIELNALQSSHHTHWQSAEQLTRALCFSCLEAAKTWGIEPKTALFADMSGICWSAVSAYRDLGIRYAALLPNGGFRLSKDGDTLPRLFYWVAPNRKDKLLTFYQSGYRDMSMYWFLNDTNRQYDDGTYQMESYRVRKLTEAIDEMIMKLGDVPYDILPVSYYDDRECPTDMLLRVCDGMQEKWAYPRFCMNTPGKTLAEIEERFSDAIPQIHGELNEQWADFATIAPEWFSVKRRAAAFFPRIETIASLKALVGEPYPQKQLREAMWRMCEFDDHCWATSAKDPLEMHRFNLYLVKRESARRAHEIVEKQMARYIGKPNEKEGSVWNLTELPRTDLLYTDMNHVPKGISAQSFADGTVIAGPLSISGFESKSILFGGMTELSQIVEGECFDTGCYLVELHHDTRKIVSIKEKSSGRDLLNTAKGQGLADFCFVVTKDKQDDKPEILKAEVRGLRVECGCLATRFTYSMHEQESHADITETIDFYRHSSKIDINVSYKNATGLMGKYEDRYLKNIFIEFPFRVDNHSFYEQLPGKTVCLDTELIPYNPNDFFCCEGYIAVQNDEGGIAILSEDMPVYHLGGIHYNRLSAHNDLSESSSVFVYAASNRCNQLNLTSADECKASFHIVLQPYEGNCEQALAGWTEKEMMHLQLGEKENEAFNGIKVDKENVRLQTLKKAEAEQDAFILRLNEQTGLDTNDVKVTLPFIPVGAWLCNAREENSGIVVPCYGNKLKVSIGANKTLSILIRTDSVLPVNDEPDDIIRNVFSFACGDDKSIVSWEVTDRSIPRFDIFDAENGILINTVKSSCLRVQYAILPLSNRDFMVRPSV